MGIVEEVIGILLLEGNRLALMGVGGLWQVRAPVALRQGIVDVVCSRNFVLDGISPLLHLDHLRSTKTNDYHHAYVNFTCWVLVLGLLNVLSREL